MDFRILITICEAFIIQKTVEKRAEHETILSVVRWYSIAINLSDNAKHSPRSLVLFAPRSFHASQNPIFLPQYDSPILPRHVGIPTTLHTTTTQGAIVVNMAGSFSFEIIGEKNLHQAALPGRVACCPSMDLTALATADHQVLIYRLNGQRVYGSAQKSGSPHVEAIQWKPNGASLDTFFTSLATSLTPLRSVASHCMERWQCQAHRRRKYQNCSSILSRQYSIRRHVSGLGVEPHRSQGKFNSVEERCQ